VGTNSTDTRRSGEKNVRYVVRDFWQVRRKKGWGEAHGGDKGIG
jgi:hypothetical protein